MCFIAENIKRMPVPPPGYPANEQPVGGLPNYPDSSLMGQFLQDSPAVVDEELFRAVKRTLSDAYTLAMRP